MISATPTQTSEFSARKTADLGLDFDAYTRLGRTNLICSRVGFGGYRIDQRSPAYGQALQMAIQQGCNLIDTSTNYTDGESEKVIGNVLQRMFTEGEVSRDELIVVSKVGYIQGQNLLATKQRSQKWPDLVEYSENCWHCIHPEFIRSQLKESLQRLGLSKLDVYLLHNPEYFFLANKPKNESELKELRKLFYQRMAEAFATLEDLVAEGLISAYGVSSNSLGYAQNHAEAVSLTELIAIARAAAEKRHKAAEQHHFSVVQFPMNVLEQEPLITHQEAGQSLLQHVIDFDVGALINRPLNAFFQQHLYRLVDIEMEQPPSFVEELQALATLEEEYNQRIAPELNNPALKGLAMAPWAEQLRMVRQQGYHPSDIETIEHEVVRPQMRQLMQQIGSLLTEEEMEVWAMWRARYWPQLLQTMAVLQRTLQWEQKQILDGINHRLNAARVNAWKNLRWHPYQLGYWLPWDGVSCVLNGMRQPRYVATSTALFRRGLIAHAGKVLRDVARG